MTRLTCPHCNIFLSNAGKVDALPVNQVKKGKCRYCHEPIEIVVQSGILLAILKGKKPKIKSNSKLVTSLKLKGITNREIYRTIELINKT